MNLKDKLILLSDKLDMLGLQKDADVIDDLLNKIASEGVIKILEEESEEDGQEQNSWG